MTIKEAFKRLQYDRSDTPCYHPTFDIWFINSDGESDTTQFTTESLKSAEKELSEFFNMFCKDEGFRRNSVLSITWVDDN